MKFFQRAIALSLLLVLTGQGCTKGPTPEAVQLSKPAELNVWTVIDDANVYDQIFWNYRKLHPNVSINLRRLRLEDYEQTLVDALAEDRGPDVFMIHNDWTGKYLSKILPMPAATKVTYKTVTGTVKKEVVTEVRSEPTISLREYKDKYADVAVRDTVRLITTPPSTPNGQPVTQEKIVGLPLTLDTLALYYNKDLLNAAGVLSPPETWNEFQALVPKFTRVDANNNLTQSMAGIGTALNVERATDLATILMMQNGAEMMSSDGKISFHETPPALYNQRSEPPAFQAMRFYTDFADPTKETYTWNAAQPNSLDAFLQGRTAFFFGYAYHLPLIRARAPKINLGISKLPQIAGNPVRNFANYWFMTVSKKTKNPDVAWNLLNYLAQDEQTKPILAAAKRPAAKRSLLADQLNDEDIGVFASQVLTATSWYQGKNPRAAEDAIRELITNAVTTDSQRLRDAFQLAADKVAQTMY